MSFEDKRFCFTCKQTSEQLALKDKKLKFCTNCKIAEYCGKECQLQDFVFAHKEMCNKVFVKLRKEAAEMEQKIKTLGFDVKETKVDFKKLSENNPQLLNLAAMYQQVKDVSIRVLGQMARIYESYHGLQSVLDQSLKSILEIQPTFFAARYYLPLTMLQLGKDDDAYNFIKFWLKITPIDQNHAGKSHCHVI